MKKKTEKTVICGGKGYKLGDKVIYAPVGTKKGGRYVDLTDFKGVTSEGLILSFNELNQSPDKNQIFVVPSNKNAKLGQQVVEVFKSDLCPESLKDKNLVEEMKKRNKQVRDVLKGMEGGKDKNLTELWEKTRKWSIDDFKDIYKWADCRFDHFFHESDVGEESKDIVLQAYKEGKLIKSDGAIGAQLGKKLGFCVLLTSDGTGLYATKDIALAKLKFEKYQIERSVYVVDVGQSLHFQQVFAVLKLLGFKQASKCHHLSYGIVTLPEGKMSSRKGSVIYFSLLKRKLLESIYEEYLKKYENEWPKEEIEETNKRLAVATIKYGMLNQDTKKDIVFSLKEWIAKTGNTGPYIMYGYARIKSILRTVKVTDEEKKLVDFGLLTNQKERVILNLLNEFLRLADQAATSYKPHYICVYLYTLAKQFNKMYEEVSVKNAETAALKATRLEFIRAVSVIMHQGMALLGIKTVERM